MLTPTRTFSSGSMAETILSFGMHSFLVHKIPLYSHVLAQYHVILFYDSLMYGFFSLTYFDILQMKGTQKKDPPPHECSMKTLYFDISAILVLLVMIALLLQRKDHWNRTAPLDNIRRIGPYPIH